MNTRLILLLISIITGSLTSCVTIPVKNQEHHSKCAISSDRMTLKIINLNQETHTYYSISGTFLSPILVPTTAILSGTYVLINNIYNLGEEKIKCEAN
jgi:hypothetical protein